jgi:hypothetical protein
MRFKVLRGRYGGGETCGVGAYLMNVPEVSRIRLANIPGAVKGKWLSLCYLISGYQIPL